MELRQVEAFRAVARYGGFSRAARALAVAQPSLTRSVARLEATIGFPLFLRGQGAARLTPEGDAFLREVERAFTGLDRLRVAAQDIRNFGTGRLRFACLPALAGGLMADALASFLQSRPEATVSLQVNPSNTIYEWVASRQVDLGLASPRSGFPAVEEQEFLSIPAVLVVPRGHPLARLRRPAGPHDVAEERFLALSLADGARHAAEEVFRGAGVAPRLRLETPNSETLCRFVAAGLGVALVNPLVVADAAKGLAIATLPFAPEVRLRYLLLRLRGEVPDRLSEAFAAELLAHAAEAALQPRRRW